jgi:hypothetical protein
VKVKRESHDFTERELKILEVLLLNAVVFGTSRLVNKGAFLNPIVSDERDMLLNKQIVIEEEVENSLFDKIKEDLDRRLFNSLKRCGVDNVEINILPEY